MKCVLNVGGGGKHIPIPAHYDGWDQVILDIDDAGDPDLVIDARELTTLPAGIYDAVYCSHNLEHYWRHDVPRVLAGFAHVLAPHGFAEIAVPDLMAVFGAMQKRSLDLDDVLYVSPSGPITVNDVIYGYGVQIERSGNDFYAHKNAFTTKSLAKALATAGLPVAYTRCRDFEIRAFAFKRAPVRERVEALALGELLAAPGED